jgi:crotonobetainyl-CoA:carnitine CoA-transferase CaiB-like acyl-CoA transferase
VAEPGDSYAYAGVDTDTVLGEFGFSASEIEKLRESGAVA